MRVARVDVSEEYLAQALHFPEGTLIIGIRMIEPSPRATYELTVVSDQLKEAGDEEAPKLSPLLTSIINDECGHVVKVSMDWRQGDEGSNER